MHSTIFARFDMAGDSVIHAMRCALCDGFGPPSMVNLKG